jgi:hypothetical protein
MTRTIKVRFISTATDFDGEELAEYIEEQFEQTAAYELGDTIEVLSITQNLKEEKGTN